jgi:hypothetical protein
MDLDNRWRERERVREREKRKREMGERGEKILTFSLSLKTVKC